MRHHRAPLSPGGATTTPSARSAPSSPGGSQKGIRPNVRISSSELERASKARKLSGTPTPPPMEVAPRSSSQATRIDSRNDGFEGPPSLPFRRRRRRVRLSWAAVVAAITLFVVGSFNPAPLRQAKAKAAGALSSLWSAAAAKIQAGLKGESTKAPAEPPKADAPPPMKLNRAGHVSVPGGILVLPSTFETTDGSYDLLVHFHGNTSVVKESVEVAKLNAAVAIINVGVGSGPYEEYYAQPGTYEELLSVVDHGLRQRGVVNAHLRRVALSGWSAGYGAVSTILHVRKHTDPLDAVLLFDGIHCSWEGASSATLIQAGASADPASMSPELAQARASGVINTRQLASFLDTAKDAADGHIYFGITHSEIDPITYVSTALASNYLVKEVGADLVPLDPAKDAPHYVELESMANAVDHSKEKTMEPVSDARKGSFHVIGYKGETQEHHMAHLFEMSQTLLPELVARWSDPSP